MTTQRLEAFSDGVFSVAITILAFDVRLPALPDPLSEDRLAAALVALGPKLLSYVMSFVLVGMFWIAHHRIFQAIRRLDRGLMWLNLIFLLWIGLLPFSAATYGGHIAMRSAAVVYGANVILIGQTLFWLWRYACSKKQIAVNITPEYVRLTNLRILSGTPAYLLGIGCAFADAHYSLWVYVAALTLYLIPARIDKHYVVS